MEVDTIEQNKEKTDNSEQAEDLNIPLDFTSLKNQVMMEMKTHMNSGNGRKFTSDEIREMLTNPQGNVRQLRQASLYLMNTSSHYMRLIFYMARMLTLDYIVSPVLDESKPKVVKTRKFKESYRKAEEYMSKFNVKHEISKILLVVLIEDVYYGYERRVGSSYMVQRMPSDYCRIMGVEDGNFVYEMDMTYFDSDRERLDNFPKEFARLYRKYKSTHERWQQPSSEYSVCIKFREDINYPLPPFASIFEEVLNLEDLKDLAKSKNKLENFKLLLQKIPFKKDPKSERDFLISLESVKMFHNGIKAVLPDQIGLISTPMDVEDYSFERKNNSALNNMTEAEEEIFSSAGVPSGLFNSGSTSSVGLNRAIQTDESMMFGLLRQVERTFCRRLRKFKGEGYVFEAIFPDLTVYNRDDKIDLYLKTAQYGYPKLLVNSALGLSQNQLVGMMALENECLDLTDRLKPLTSSHTMGKEGEVGNVEKKDSQLTDKGIETRDGGENDERDSK